MPKRNDKRDTAKAEYIKRRRSGEKVNLKDLAEKLGVTYGTVRNWKRIDQWDDAVERKRGGQPGNKNSRGKRNAKGNPGGGAPNGNTNAEKDGAYSTVHLERLSQEERDWLDQMPTGANENNIYAAKFSQHLYGKAADIWISGVTVEQIAAYAETLLPNRGGIGRYPKEGHADRTHGWVHIDTRAAKSRWVS